MIKDSHYSMSGLNGKLYNKPHIANVALLRKLFRLRVVCKKFLDAL